MLVSGSQDNTLKLWDAATGRELRTLTSDTDTVSAVAFAPNGKTVVSACALTLTLWDAATGRVLHTLEGHRVSIFAAAFSPDGRTIVSGSYDTRRLILWDASDRAPAPNSQKGHTAKAIMIGMHPTNTGSIRLRSRPTAAPSPRAAKTDTLKLWSAANRQRTANPCRPYLLGELSCIFARRPHVIASGSEDNTIKLWDAASGRELRSLVGHMNSVNSVGFSSDGRMIVSGGEDGTLRLWSLAGEPLATSIAGSGDAWLTMTPEEFFDSSDSGTKLLAAVRGLRCLLNRSVLSAALSP